MADPKPASPPQALNAPANGSGPEAFPRLGEDQIAGNLQALPDWSENGGTLQRTYQFKNFLESMRFVNRVAEQAEADQHHPDILVRWNKVTLTLSTHDAGGITDKDFALARKSDDFSKAIAGPSPVVTGAKRARK